MDPTSQPADRLRKQKMGGITFVYFMDDDDHAADLDFRVDDEIVSKEMTPAVAKWCLQQFRAIVDEVSPFHELDSYLASHDASCGECA